MFDLLIFLIHSVVNMILKSLFDLWVFMMYIEIVQVVIWIVVAFLIVDHFAVELVENVLGEMLWKVSFFDVGEKVLEFKVFERLESELKDIELVFEGEWSCVDLDFLFVDPRLRNAFES